MASDTVSRLAFPAKLEDKKLPISENGMEVLKRRYLRKSTNGDPDETVQWMFWRVASTVATGAEKELDATKWAETYYSLMTNMLFMPNSPTFMGAGTPLGQLAACFVMPIDDDMGREQNGIFNTLRNAALVQQTGGGIGFSFSRLRPENDIVSTSMGRSSGPLSFMRTYDTAFSGIAQGGTRRGASMAVLRVDHPDIEKFIKCKTEEGRINNFNISVGITDAFMRAVSDDKEFALVNPRTKATMRMVRAQRLFELIATQAHHNGEPGVVFLDTANRANTVPDLYTFECTNPCGEQFLGPYENCCLGSINLALHTIVDELGKTKIDWASLEKTVRVSTRFLDDVVSANKYVPAVPQLKEAAHRVRRIGLGIMGLADMCYRVGVRYGSPQCISLSEQVMEFVRFHAMRTSVDLVKDDGREPFPAIKQSVFSPDDFTWTPPTHGNVDAADFGCPELDWTRLTEDIKKHGIRNGAHTTVAPTGTIGTVVGCEGYGCEPVFALAYTRQVKEASGDVELSYTSPLFLEALNKAGISDADRDAIVAEVLRCGSCQSCEKVPEHVRRVFVISQDLTAEEHVDVQAALQRFVDNSISKTINLPPSATVEDVKKAYTLGWESGCKGMTVYVTGSRQSVVLETADEKSRKRGLSIASERPMSPFAKKRPRPLQLNGTTYRSDTPLGEAHVTVNHTLDNQPFEVFINVGKGGSEVAAMAEAIGRLISLTLRLPSEQSPAERMQQVAEQLDGIGGVMARGLGPNKVLSLPDGIASALNKHMSQMNEPGFTTPTSPVITITRSRSTRLDLCPDCGQGTLLHVEGCKKCSNCGRSEC